MDRDDVESHNIKSYLLGPTERVPRGCKIIERLYLVKPRLLRYSFSYVSNRSYQFAQPELEEPEYGAWHSSELYYIFQALPAGTAQPLIDLSIAMLDYW